MHYDAQIIMEPGPLNEMKAWFGKLVENAFSTAVHYCYNSLFQVK